MLGKKEQACILLGPLQHLFRETRPERSAGQRHAKAGGTADEDNRKNAVVKKSFDLAKWTPVCPVSGVFRDCRGRPRVAVFQQAAVKGGSIGRLRKKPALETRHCRLTGVRVYCGKVTVKKQTIFFLVLVLVYGTRTSTPVLINNNNSYGGP